jgi:hypothetical protein
MSTQPTWSAQPPADSGRWITPPPLNDGSDVWSAEQYASATDGWYREDASYAPYNSYSTSPPSFRSPGSYPYYSNFDNAAPQSLPPYWPQSATRLRTDGFAIAALVFGILGVWILGFGFGIAAVRRINRGVRGGRGLALAGIWLSVAWVIVIVLAISTSTLVS